MSKLIKTAEGESPYMAPLSGPLPSAGGPTTIADIIDTQHLGYKLKVLVWDLYHFEDPDSSSRLCTAFDNLDFIGYPYFSDNEAAYILSAPTRVYRDRTDAPRIQCVRDALFEHLDAFYTNWDRRQRYEVGSRLPVHGDIAHIFLFVFGITFIQLGSMRFQRQLREYGLKLVPKRSRKENAYEKQETGPKCIV